MNTIITDVNIVRFFTLLGADAADITVSFLIAQCIGLIVTVIGVVGVQFNDIR